MIVLGFFFYNRSWGSEINIYHMYIKRKFSLLYIYIKIQYVTSVNMELQLCCRIPSVM